MENEINKIFELPETSFNLRDALSKRITELIDTDFHKLITLLYRFDISEKKLKEKLSAPHHNTGELIADMIIEREAEKKKSRENFSSQAPDVAETEKW